MLTPDPEAQQTPFNPAAQHHIKPKIRALRGFPADMGNQKALGLADARQISDRIIVTSPAFQVVLPLMDGSRTIDEIVAQVGRGLTRPVLEPLVAQLDGAGLLFGPTFDAMLAKMRADFDGSPNLPPAVTGQFAEMLGAQVLGDKAKEATPEAREEAGVPKMKELFDAWIAKALEEADNPSLDRLPKAIVAPHLDYARGWMNYAAVYGRLRVVDRPDRVVILGTNHHGEGTGIAACDKGFQSPFGICEPATDIIEGLRAKLGDKLFASRYDHEREHSIELHIPWIQHVFAGEGGKLPTVFAALVHDPAVNNGESYDGKGIALDPFIAALRDVLAGLPGTTLVVSSADLSHAGPAFGDQISLASDTPEAEAARNKVIQHDREMLDLVRDNKPDELVAAMAWQQNPTRWCSVGNLVATIKVVQPQEIEILNYMGTMDPEGNTLVTSFAAAMF